MTNMHDSGERQEFTTGAIRDTAEDKPRPSLISPFLIERLGMWCALGAKKYSDRNWEKGMPFSRVMDSLERHIMKYKMGLQDEDHLAAIAWNAMALIHYEEMIKRGILSEELNDMPDYKDRLVGIVDKLVLKEEINLGKPETDDDLQEALKDYFSNLVVGSTNNDY